MSTPQEYPPPGDLPPRADELPDVPGSDQPRPVDLRPRTRTLVRRGSRSGGRFLGGMRVRKKVLFLHTLFWLGLALVLMVPLRPAINEVVEQAEIDEAAMILRLVAAELEDRGEVSGTREPLWSRVAPQGTLRSGNATELGITPASEAQARAAPGRPVSATLPGRRAGAAMYIPAPTPDGQGQFLVATATIPDARRAVFQLFILTAASLLAIYALVAAALELFVLPQHVYGPITRMLDADRAVQEGDQEHELIPESVIASDELGSIMRSRNNSITSLRRHEKALAEALAELERVATDLKRKNHLLEAARRNLADADRLASLGMMSAGIAHELNTPLAVLKGLVEKLNQKPQSIDRPQAELMLRVVHRLERLGESLLDFARVRPPQTRSVLLRSLVDEASTLVSLDRGHSGAEFVNHVPESIVAECDPDRMVQVLVNLLRNAADATREGAGSLRRDDGEHNSSGERQQSLGFGNGSGGGSGANGGDGGDPPGSTGRSTERLPPHTVDIAASVSLREGNPWISLTVTDNGVGIDPDLLSRLFEPFVSTRLDAHGTGLGLAVAEGIVREHGGLILARNRQDGRGAIFEVMIPVRAMPYAEGDTAGEAEEPRPENFPPAGTPER
jgi:signal transduction histidine kinase